MKYGRINKYLALSIIIALCFTSLAFSHERINGQALGKATVSETGYFDGNRIFDYLENNGMLVSHRITGNSGMEWPKGSGLLCNFASGIWIGGKVGQQIRVAAAEYSPEFVPGPYGSNPDDPVNQIYKVNKSDLADPLASDDFQNWPVDLGAPWVDEDGDGVYEPMPNGPDHPEFLGDQVIWYVINDGSVAEHGIFQTPPLGVEMQITIWGYNRPDAFGDMMFVKAKIINKGGNVINDCYIGLWDDPDMGDAGDDFVGCDTTLSLGYCYNDGADADYGTEAPAIGYDFFQGPIVPSSDPTDTAFAFGQYWPGMKNLPMTSFIKYINTSDETWSDPETAEEAYNLMQGLTKVGTPFINTLTGQPANFVLPGDPVTGTGWIDAVDHSSGDRRFLMNTGPFTLNPDDEQEVVFGILLGRGKDALNSITVLKENDKLAQLAYDIQFALPPSPPNPNVTVTELPSEIILRWDDVAESYETVDKLDKMPVPSEIDTVWTTDITYTVTYDTVITGTDTTITADTTFQFVQVIDHFDTTFAGEDTKFRFEGYAVYQVETATGSGEKKLLAVYDLKNGIVDIRDNVFDTERGENVEVTVMPCKDTGIKRYYETSVDALNNNSALINNRPYYFAVTAFGYNKYGIPKILESPAEILTVYPQKPTELSTNTVYNDSLETVTHSQGGSDGSVEVWVVDPTVVTGHDYEIFFTNEITQIDSTYGGTDSVQYDTTFTIAWNVRDKTLNTVVLDKQFVQSGIDLRTGEDVGNEVYPIVDGLQIKVNGPSDGIHGIWQVANANGSIPGVDEDPNENILWINFLTAPDYPTQQAQGGWVFVTHGGGTPNDMESFYERVFRGSNFDNAIPNDFEMRFTAQGSKAWMAYSSGSIVDVPFELWCIGTTPDDPSDDFQMICWIYDVDGDDQFSFSGDDPSSSGDNDPASDWIYWRKPADTSPGNAGYLACANDPDYGYPGLIGPETMARTRLMNWNRYLGGGDIFTTGGPLDSASALLARPETGTVIRWITNKPNALTDVFSFSTGSVASESKEYKSAEINVYPNPYFGHNVLERTPYDRFVTFTHLPPYATIRIFSLSGALVRTIEHTPTSGPDEQYERWNLKNAHEIPVVSGIYIVHVEGKDSNGKSVKSKILKLAIFQPEERLDVW